MKFLILFLISSSTVQRILEHRMTIFTTLLDYFPVIIQCQMSVQFVSESLPFAKYIGATVRTSTSGESMDICIMVILFPLELSNHLMP